MTHPGQSEHCTPLATHYWFRNKHVIQVVLLWLNSTIFIGTSEERLLFSSGINERMG